MRFSAADHRAYGKVRVDSGSVYGDTGAFIVVKNNTTKTITTRDIQGANFGKAVGIVYDRPRLPVSQVGLDGILSRGTRGVALFGPVCLSRLGVRFLLSGTEPPESKLIGRY